MAKLYDVQGFWVVRDGERSSAVAQTVEEVIPTLIGAQSPSDWDLDYSSPEPTCKCAVLLIDDETGYRNESAIETILRAWCESDVDADDVAEEFACCADMAMTIDEVLDGSFTAAVEHNAPALSIAAKQFVSCTTYAVALYAYIEQQVRMLPRCGAEVYRGEELSAWLAANPQSAIWG